MDRPLHPSSLNGMFHPEIYVHNHRIQEREKEMPSHSENAYSPHYSKQGLDQKRPVEQKIITSEELASIANVPAHTI